MTLEMLLVFLAGAVVVMAFRRETTVQSPDPASLLRAVARSGVTIKVEASKIEGGWVLRFAFDENLDELSKQALAMRDDGRKIEAIKLVRERLGIGLKEAKDYVEAL